MINEASVKVSDKNGQADRGQNLQTYIDRHRSWYDLYVKVGLFSKMIRS